MRFLKVSVIAVTAIFLFCCAVYAADDCDTKYNKYINALKKTNKIMAPQKQKYVSKLEKAHKLCKQDKMTEAAQVMEELKDQFFQDALLADHTFWSN